jgi:hypothetical protein
MATNMGRNESTQPIVAYVGGVSSASANIAIDNVDAITPTSGYIDLIKSKTGRVIVQMTKSEICSCIGPTV